MGWFRTLARFVGFALAICFLLLLAAAAAVYFFPEAVCQHALMFLLERQGLRRVEFTVAEANRDHIRLESVQIGPDEVGLSVAAVDVAFTWPGLRERRLDHIDVTSARAIALEGKSGWSIGGVSGGRSDGGGGWYFGQLSVRDSSLEVFADENDLGGTLAIESLRVDRAGLDHIDLVGKGGLEFALGDREIPLGLAVTGELRRAESGERLFQVSCAEVNAGLLAECRGTFPFQETGGTNIAVSVRCDELSRAQDLLSLVLPDDLWWSDVEFAGGLTLEASAVGTDLSGRCVLHQVGVALPHARLAARGLEADIAITGFRPPSTPADQVVTFASVETSGLSLGDGRVAFQVSGRHFLRVEDFSGRMFGGVVRAEPFTLDFSRPSLDLEFTAEQFGLDQLSSMQSRVQCEAEGTVDGALHVTWRPGTFPRVKGHLASPPGGQGRIRFTDPSLVTDQMAGQDEFKVKAVALSLRDFRYDRFRVALDLSDDETATATLNLSGRSALNLEAPPINLNVNFEADIEDVMYLGRLYRRMGGR